MVVSSSSSSSNLYITGQQVTGKPGTNADFWNPQTYGPNSEEWVTVAVKPTLDQDPVVLGLGSRTRKRPPRAASRPTTSIAPTRPTSTNSSVAPTASEPSPPE